MNINYCSSINVRKKKLLKMCKFAILSKFLNSGSGSGISNEYGSCGSGFGTLDFHHSSRKYGFLFSLSGAGVGPELCGRPADDSCALGCGVPGTDGLSCPPYTRLLCCLSQVRGEASMLNFHLTSHTVKGYRHLKKLNASQTVFYPYLGKPCKSLHIF